MNRKQRRERISSSERTKRHKVVNRAEKMIEYFKGLVLK